MKAIAPGVLLVLLCLAALVGVKRWLDGLSATDQDAWVASAQLVLPGILVLVTYWYVALTRNLVDSNQRSAHLQAAHVASAELSRLLLDVRDLVVDINVSVQVQARYEPSISALVSDMKQMEPWQAKLRECKRQVDQLLPQLPEQVRERASDLSIMLMLGESSLGRLIDFWGPKSELNRSIFGELEAERLTKEFSEAGGLPDLDTVVDRAVNAVNAYLRKA